MIIIICYDYQAQNNNGRQFCRCRASETPDGIELRAYDEEFAEQMVIAERVMREDRDVLRKLAE